MIISSALLFPQKFYDTYKQKMEGEGKKVKTGGGFHGKGYKFDESEANFASEKKKFEKAALGLADSDDEDIEQDIDQQIESMLNTKRTVKEIKVRVSLPSAFRSVNVTSALQSLLTLKWKKKDYSGVMLNHLYNRIRSCEILLQ